MTISDTIYTICSNDATLTALVADRVYRTREQPTGYPQLVYHVPISDDDSEYRDHDGGNPGRAVVVAQFDCLAETANDADDLANALISLWNGYQSSTYDIGYAFKDNRIDDGFQPGSDVFRVIVEIRIEIGV